MTSTTTLCRIAGLFCVAGLVLAPAIVHAQALTLSFAPDTQTVFPGGTATFSGTITNTTSSALYVNSDAIDPLGPGFVINDTPFYSTFGGTPVLLGAGETYAMTDFFTVTDTAAAQGLFQGQYAVYGGALPTSVDQSGFQTFTLNSPVPEASTSVSFALLLAAGSVVWAVQRRKRGAALS